MPVVYQKDFSEGWIALWKITESVEQLCELVGEPDSRGCEAFKSASRQKEWLAWRALTRELLSCAKVEYNNVGAPELIGVRGFIGVSHEREYAAVTYSQERKCAIDIECLDRNFGRAASKYISEQEHELGPGDSNRNMFNAALWCAKEVVYKYEGVEGVDFQSDISVEYLDVDSEVIRARLKGCDTLDLSLFTYDNRLVVYTSLK